MKRLGSPSEPPACILCAAPAASTLRAIADAVCARSADHHIGGVRTPALQDGVRVTRRRQECVPIEIRVCTVAYGAYGERGGVAGSRGATSYLAACAECENLA